MKYTVIYIDDSKVTFTDEVKKLFEDCRVVKTFNAEDSEMNSVIAFVNPGEDLNTKYKHLEEDFLRVKLYDIPDNISLRDWVKANFEKSRMREHYSNLTWEN